MLAFFFQTKMKKFSWKTEQKKKMETRIGNRTLFMLHGDECTFVKGHYIVERMQINMLFAAALHILYLLTFVVVVVVVVVIGGGGYSFSARLSRPL